MYEWEGGTARRRRVRAARPGVRGIHVVIFVIVGHLCGNFRGLSPLIDAFAEVTGGAARRRRVRAAPFPHGTLSINCVNQQKLLHKCWWYDPIAFPRSKNKNLTQRMN